MLGYDFAKGNIFNIKRGTGFYAKTAVQIKNFNLSTSFWYNRGYMPIYGSAFYGIMSAKIDGLTYYRPKMFHHTADYVLPLGKGFAFGVNADIYHCLPVKAYMDNTSSEYGNKISYSIGVYLRINPSFLIKQY